MCEIQAGVAGNSGGWFGDCHFIVVTGRFTMGVTQLKVKEEEGAGAVMWTKQLLTITCAFLSLGWGYYNARWSAKRAESYFFHRTHPLSARHIRIWGWGMLALGLLLLTSGIWGITEPLRT
jgi:hypothetical protein